MDDKGKIAQDFFMEYVMQDTAMSRWLSPLMAFCLSFMIIVGLAPSLGLQLDRQIDFWLLWMGTMIFLALPIIYLEIALARRSKTTALNALSNLTRDADASQQWRLVGWLSVVFIAFMAGGLLTNIAYMTSSYTQLPIHSNILFVLCAVIAFALSFVSRQILVLLTAVGVIASFILSSVWSTHVPAWQLTPIEFKEWGNATILALVASGLGLGLYWQTSLTATSQQDTASKVTLPIWIAQLIAVGAFGYFVISAQIPAYTILVTAIFAAALLLHLAKEQLQQRNMTVLIQFAVLVAGLFVWAIPHITGILNSVLMLWGLIICLIYSIFVGWIMKISHLRKALNFSGEVFYNLWRIAVRIVLPLSIVLAIVSYLGQLI